MNLHHEKTELMYSQSCFLRNIPQSLEPTGKTLNVQCHQASSREQYTEVYVDACLIQFITLPGIRLLLCERHCGCNPGTAKVSQFWVASGQVFWHMHFKLSFILFVFDLPFCLQYLSVHIYLLHFLNKLVGLLSVT